jgi:cell wall-active antibiotic response 4TMS protein YvqF
MNGNPSMIRAIRGPITLITLGVLFALNNFTQYGFSETWPVLLIVFGALTLLGRSTETSGPPPPRYGYPPSPPRPGDPSAQPSAGERR